MAHKEIDAPTGVETTGHSWDGIKELNNPLPRWWVIVFWISVIWSIAYWVFMPSWPGLTGYLKGTRNHSERANVEKAVADLQAARSDQMKRLLSVSSVSEIENDPDLQLFAITAGKSIFGDNCATCHGAGGQGNFRQAGDGLGRQRGACCLPAGKIELAEPECCWRGALHLQLDAVRRHRGERHPLRRAGRCPHC